MEPFDASITEWITCDVNDLAGHFHCYKGGNQFERLEWVHLNPPELKKLFTASGEMESFTISMALDIPAQDKTGEKKKSFTFRPVISVKYKEEGEQWDYFSNDNIVPDPGHLHQAAKVPAEFKDALSQNWVELDISNMDDVFTASIPLSKTNAPGRTPKPAPQRLLSYKFTLGDPGKPETEANITFFKFIDDLRKTHEITIIKFHLGTDMNKLNHKDKFTFSPVLEVWADLRINGGAKNKEDDSFIKALHKARLRCGVPNDTGDLPALYEYMMPCPSTCGSDS